MIEINQCFSVGDAACTIASATSFPEPFLHDGKHLRHMHRNLAGNRFSDHVALLNAFQQFEREKYFFLSFYYENFFFFFFEEIVMVNVVKWNFVIGNVLIYQQCE